LVRLPAEGFVGAAFVHTTSRLGDPQLHTHLVVANLAQGPDGAWSALDARALYRHARTAGFLYQASLRAGLTEVLGISWRSAERGMAEPAGVPAEVLSHFSRRRAEIEDALGLAGQHSAAAANIAAHQTRKPKDHSVSAEALRPRGR
jgi:conjugative relaxase-like TrwC/TraI family protein